jgi:RimJ/RimL family protein N-acetyltransferase
VERRIILETARLCVTTWLPTNLDDLNRLHSDPVTMAFIGGRPETRDESASRLDRYLVEQATRGWTKWRVASRDNQMIGRAGFGVYAEDRELGYTISRECWRQGLATEVATALVDWHVASPAYWSPDAAEHMRLWGYADIDNAASIRVLAKSGLRQVETREHAGRPYAFFRLDPSGSKPPEPLRVGRHALVRHSR